MPNLPVAGIAFPSISFWGHRGMAEYDLQSIAFPTLDEAQITRLSECTAAATKSYEDGQTLFAVGDRDFKFFIVKSGEVEIVDSRATSRSASPSTTRASSPATSPS